jgi:excisionase family DNA binding protein
MRQGMKGVRVMSDTTAIRRAYSIRQVRELTGFCNEKVYQHIRKGELLARKSGRRTFILASDLDRFLESLPMVRLGKAVAQ